MWSLFLLLPRSEPRTLENHLPITRAVLGHRAWWPLSVSLLDASSSYEASLILAVLGAAKADLARHRSPGSSAGVFKNTRSCVWQSDRHGARTSSEQKRSAPSLEHKRLRFPLPHPCLIKSYGRVFFCKKALLRPLSRAGSWVTYKSQVPPSCECRRSRLAACQSAPLNS